MKKQTIWINGRFLERQVTGVERVAREMLQALSARLNAQGELEYQGKILQFRIMLPAKSQADSPWANLAVTRRGRFGGHVWEQTSLLWHTRGDWLVSLCNTGPIFKRNHLLFLHDAQPFAIPQNFTRAFRWWYRVLFSVGGRTAKALLTNSAFSRDELVRHVGLNATKITPAWLGVDHVQRVAPDATILDQHQLKAGEYVFAVASLNPNKNFAAVVQALALLGDKAPPCVISGQRYDKVFGAEALDTSKITHVGYVSDAELYALYQNALCLVFPSFYEGFGLPPVEAMAKGCPAIVSSASVMPEVCGDAALYCNPNDAQTLADAIVQMQTTPQLREELIQKGAARVQLFSWARATDTMLKTLNQAMEK